MPTRCEHSLVSSYNAAYETALNLADLHLQSY